MRVIYLAHPVSGDVAANLASAVRWFYRIQEANPDDAIIMPWHSQCLVYDNDADAATDYDTWLDRDCEVVRRCNGLVYTGPAITKGMRREGGVALVTWDRHALDIDCDPALLVLEPK